MSSNVITSVGEEGAGRFAGRLLTSPCFVVSHFTILPLGAREGLVSLIVALPGDLFIVFFYFTMTYLYLWPCNDESDVGAFLREQLDSLVSTMHIHTIDLETYKL